MTDDQNGEFFEFRRGRRNTNARSKSPRATRSTTHKKKIGGNASAGGVHQRRNKHWSW